jgi:hypothetical protein
MTEEIQHSICTVMAKPTHIVLNGKLGNLVFYEFRGVPCTRTLPSKVRQTKATKKSARLFGRATSLSAALRGGLGNFLPQDKGRRIMCTGSMSPCFSG